MTEQVYENQRILVVDDEQEILEAYRKILCPGKNLDPANKEMKDLATRLFREKLTETENVSFELVACSQGQDAEKAVKASLEQNKPFSVAFIDVRLPPGQDGIRTAEQLRKLDPDLEMVIVTAYSDVDPADIAFRVPPQDKLLFVQKPFYSQEIRQFAVALSTKWKTGKRLLETQSDLERRVALRTAALKKAKERLEEEIARREQAHLELNQIFEAAVPLCVIDTHFNLVRLNETFCSFFLFNKKNVLGKKCYDVLRDSRCQTVSCPLAKILEGGEKSKHEDEKKLKNGKTITCVVTAVPLRGLDGNLVGIIENFTDITAIKETEIALRNREADLEQKSRHLEDANAALRVLLRQRDEQKDQIENKVLTNVKKLVMPHLESLSKSNLNPTQQDHIRILESSLMDLVSPFSEALSSAHLKLTPREIQVANLVKAGRTSKEIAGLLNVSYNAVIFHRHNIRKKLSLKNRKTNLQSYLSSQP